MRLRVVLKPDLEDGGYNVSCPALPGCHSQGDTIDDALMNVREAIEACLEALNERARRTSPDDQVLEVAL